MYYIYRSKERCCRAAGKAYANIIFYNYLYVIATNSDVARLDGCIEMR